MSLDQELEELLAALEIEAGEDKGDPGPDGYDFKREDEKRKLMQQMAFYAEEGPTVDPEGKYLCSSCYFRQLMDWGDTNACYIVEGEIKMEVGSCQFYRYGTPDSEWNPLPIKEKYTKEAANYAERPKVKGFGCYPRCEYGAVAEGQDKDGREIWCGEFKVHVRAKACCAFEDGDDLVQISAGGPGSGCNPEAGKCGRPEGEVKDASFYMHEKIGGPQGTNPGGMYRGKDGVYRYIKMYSDPKQARGEYLANNLYKALGIAAPNSVLFKKDGSDTIASEQLQGKTFAQLGMYSDNQARQVLNGFAADVLTANWDAVGTGHDNVFVAPNSTLVYRLDQGGTFLKRAKGGDKPEAVLNQITEVKGLLDKTKNPYYAEVASKIGVKSIADLGEKTDTDSFKDQVEMITALRDQAGGWKQYVSNTVPDMPLGERVKIAGMLDARTNLMENLVKQQSDTGWVSVDEPEAKVPDWAIPKTPATPAQSQDTGGKWRKYNPNNIGGYFRPGTTIADMYQTLTAKEGQWHPISDFEGKHAGKANIGNRVIELKYTGKRSGLWQLEVSGKEVRIFLNKVGAKQIGTDVADDKQKFAADFAKKMISTQDYNKDQALPGFMKSMGVTDQSWKILKSSVKDWTGSSDSKEAQNWRQVAMEFYGRNPAGEYVSSYSHLIIGNEMSTQRAASMRPAALAMKAYTSEYAKALGVTQVYRNVGGDLAKEIVSALKSGKTQIQVAMNSLSSWSDKPSLSLGGGVKIRLKIDPDNVWAIHDASPELFSAHKHEREWVIGAKVAKETFSINDISVESGDLEKYHLTPDEAKKFKKNLAAEKEDDVYVCVNHFDDDWLHKDEEESDEEKE